MKQSPLHKRQLPLPSTSVNEFYTTRGSGSSTLDKINRNSVLSRTPHLQQYDFNRAISVVSFFCLLVEEWNGYHYRCCDWKTTDEPFGGELLLVADVFVMCDNPGVVVWTQILIPVEVKYRHGTEQFWDTELAVFSVFLSSVFLQSHVMFSSELFDICEYK